MLQYFSVAVSNICKYMYVSESMPYVTHVLQIVKKNKAKKNYKLKNLKLMTFPIRYAGEKKNIYIRLSYV